MPKAAERQSEFGPLIESIAVQLLTIQVILRLLITGGLDAGNDFMLSGLIWLAAAVYFLARGQSPGPTLRFSGLELPLIFLCFFGLLSVNQAGYRFPAQERAFAWVSNVLFFVILLDTAHRRGIGRIWTVLSATGFVIVLYALLQHVVLLEEIVRDAGPDIKPGVLGRARSGQPFGTFLLSNMLAGFIAVTLPILLGSILECKKLAGRTPFWMSPNAVLRGLYFLLMVLVLFWTESRGGQAAAAAGLGAFGLLILARRRGWTRKKLAGIALAAVATAVVALWPLGGIQVLRKAKTFQLRYDAYWPAAIEMIKEAPWGGVGLENYEEHYTRVKPELQTESRNTHNDYLQVAAEIGIPGGVLFVLVWLLALWRGARGDKPTVPPERAPPEHWGILVAVGLVGFLGAALIGGRFLNDLDAGWAMAVAMLACWIIYVCFTRSADAAMDAAPGTGISLGAMAGIVAFMIHATVDFDFYSHGLSQYLFAVLAILMARGVQTGFIPFPRPAAWLMSLACLGFAMYVLVLTAPDVQRAEALRAEAEELLGEARRLDAEAPERKSAYDRIKRILSEDFYGDTEESEAGARELNEQDAEIVVLLARVLFDEWRTYAADVKTAQKSERLDPLHEDAQELITFVLEGGPISGVKQPPLRPHSASAHFFAGQMAYAVWDHFTRMARTVEDRNNLYQARANSSVALAEVRMTQAVKLYPTNARYNAWLARVKLVQGQPLKAEGWAQLADRLDGLAKQMGEPGLQLDFQEREWVSEILDK